MGTPPSHSPLWGSHLLPNPIEGGHLPTPFWGVGGVSALSPPWAVAVASPAAGGVGSISRKFLPGIIAGEGGAGGATPPEPCRKGLMPPGRVNATGRASAGPGGSRMDAGSLPEVMGMGSLLCAGSG